MAGADPSFNEAHIMRTLFLISKQPTGRKRLVQLLGVGEGSVRTIIKRLSGEGLITSSKAGHQLTKKGAEKTREYLKLTSQPTLINSDDLAPGAKAAIIVYGRQVSPSQTVSLRDESIKAGADGAVILSIKDGRIIFPDGNMTLKDYPQTRKTLDALPACNGDSIIITFSQEENKSLNAAIKVALKTLKPP
jgi:predicted transcriptional regulator